jgi:hypothetical protein
MSHSESSIGRSRLEPFFVHVGSFVAVIVYFVVLGSAPDPAARVSTALPVALAVMSGYMLAAHRVGLLKQFDIDGAQALLDRQYSIEGDGAILMRFGEWFPSRR